MIYLADKALAHTTITITEVENFALCDLNLLFHEEFKENIVELAENDHLFYLLIAN